MTSIKSIISGAIMLIASLPASGEDGRIYHDELAGRNLRDTVVIVTAPNETCLSKAIEVRGSCAASRKGKANPAVAYGVTWGNDSDGSRFQATLRSDASSDSGDFIDRPAIILTVEHFSGDGSSETILEKKIFNDVELIRCNNTIAAEIDCREGSVEVFVGDSRLNHIASLDISPESASLPMGVVVIGNPEIEIAVSEYLSDREASLSTDYTSEGLNRYFSDSIDKDPIEGFWKYLDRDNDPRYCRPGGLYTLAIISDGKGAYDIIYMEGAETAASAWHTGMKKGHLQPTQFKGHYNLIWYDAMMNEISDDCSATLDQDAILRCDFPLLKTAIRYSKIPMDK